MQISLEFVSPSGLYYGVSHYTLEEAVHVAEMRGYGYCDTDPKRLDKGEVVSVYVPHAQRARFCSDFAARFNAQPPPPDRVPIVVRILPADARPC